MRSERSDQQREKGYADNGRLRRPVSDGVNTNKRTGIFNKYAEQYDNWYEKNKDAYLSEIEALKRVVPERGRGLEIGVGTGRFAQALGISTGIDPAANMLQIARERGINAITGRGEELPFGNGEFDFVLMVITLSFVKNPEKVIEESRRVLKDKGRLIIGIVDRDSHLGNSYKAKKEQERRFYKEANFFSATEVMELFKEHNFKEISALQTIFQPLSKIKGVENPEEGFGKGGFVVICGKKG